MSLLLKNKRSQLMLSHNLIKHLISCRVLERLQVLFWLLLLCLLMSGFGARISKSKFRELKALGLLIFCLWFCSNLFGLVMLLKPKILILLLLVLHLCLLLFLWLVFFFALNKIATKLNNFLQFYLLRKFSTLIYCLHRLVVCLVQAWVY